MIEHYRQKSTGKAHTPETREKIGAAQRGEKNHRFGQHSTPEERINKAKAMAMFTPEQVAEILSLREQGATYKQLCAKFGGSLTGMRRVVKGERLAYRLIKEQLNVNS